VTHGKASDREDLTVVRKFGLGASVSDKTRKPSMDILVFMNMSDNNKGETK